MTGRLYNTELGYHLFLMLFCTVLPPMPTYISCYPLDIGKTVIKTKILGKYDYLKKCIMCSEVTSHCLICKDSYEAP